MATSAVARINVLRALDEHVQADLDAINAEISRTTDSLAALYRRRGELEALRDIRAAFTGTDAARPAAAPDTTESTDCPHLAARRFVNGDVQCETCGQTWDRVAWEGRRIA